MAKSGFVDILACPESRITISEGRRNFYHQLDTTFYQWSLIVNAECTNGQNIVVSYILAWPCPWWRTKFTSCNTSITFPSHLLIKIGQYVL